MAKGKDENGKHWIKCLCRLIQSLKFKQKVRAHIVGVADNSLQHFTADPLCIFSICLTRKQLELPVELVPVLMSNWKPRDACVLQFWLHCYSEMYREMRLLLSASRAGVPGLLWALTCVKTPKQKRHCHVYIKKLLFNIYTQCFWNMWLILDLLW